jgi:hypothetical protein
MMTMTMRDPTHTEGALEECLDEIHELVTTLDRFPPTVVAIALSVHLQSLLRALLEFDLCTRQQVRELVNELDSEVFEGIDA